MKQGLNEGDEKKEDAPAPDGDLGEFNPDEGNDDGDGEGDAGDAGDGEGERERQCLAQAHLTVHNENRR